jgi:hypothetical protein
MPKTLRFAIVFASLLTVAAWGPASAQTQSLVVSPSQFYVYDVENFVKLAGASLGQVETAVTYTQGDTVLTVEAQLDPTDLSLVEAFVPFEVSNTLGHWDVRVIAYDGAGARIYGPASLDIIERPEFVLPPSLPEVLVVEAGVDTLTFDAGGASCSVESGASLGLGTTRVLCTFAGQSYWFDAVVTDSTPPVLTLPSDITTLNHVVAFEAFAVDNLDGPLNVACTPASGSEFPDGETLVECGARDNYNNDAAGSFLVTVGPPVFHLSGDSTTEATGPNGALVTYEATVGSGTIECSPASGAQFALGTTPVNCSATNAVGSSTASFNVSVVDTTAPSLLVPGDFSVNSPSTTGVVVNYTTASTDLVSGNVPVICTLPTGATFPLGTTLVECTATDAYNNSTSGSFNVTVNFVVTNLPPSAGNDTATTLEAIPVTIPVLVNDSDPEGTALALVSASAPAHGTAVISGSSIVYTPASVFAGTDTFTYVVADVPAGATATATVTVTVNRLGRFVALGEDQVWLRSKAQVLTGDVGAATAIQLPPGNRHNDDDGENDRTVEVRLGPNADVLQPGSRVVGDTVWLRSNATVVNVLYNELENRHGTINGTSTHPIAVPYVTMPDVPTVVAGTQAVTVAKNATVTLPPGRYGTVEVKEKGKLILSGGLYEFGVLHVGQEGTVLFRAATDLRIATELDTNAKAKLIVDTTVAGLTAAKVMIAVLGGDNDCEHNGNGDDGDNAGPTVVHIGSQNTITANIYAPHGTLWIRSKSDATGAFIGERVRIGEKVVLKLDSGYK